MKNPWEYTLRLEDGDVVDDESGKTALFSDEVGEFRYLFAAAPDMARLLLRFRHLRNAVDGDEWLRVMRKTGVVE